MFININTLLETLVMKFEIRINELIASNSYLVFDMNVSYRFVE